MTVCVDAASSAALYAYPVELTGRELREDIEDGRHKGPEMYDAIGRCSEKEHTERLSREILLELDPPVHCQ